MVFALAFDHPGDGHIVCLNSTTLAVRFRFGRGGDNLAICGDELFVTARGKLEVFSFSGEHRREITGGFWSPSGVMHFDGRLFLWESGDEDEAPEEDYAKLGKRIFVLTPQGATLQVYDFPEGLAQLLPRYAPIYEVAVVARKLILSFDNRGNEEVLQQVPAHVLIGA